MNASVCIALALILLISLNGAASAADSTWKIGEPIVTYYAGPTVTDEVAKLMKAGGWNTVWCTIDNIDIAHKYGLRAMIHNGLLQPETLDDPAKWAELDAFVDRVKNHPAMYSYYIVDEPNASRFPGLGRLVAYLRERDPAHMAYINLFPVYASDEQLGTTAYSHDESYRKHLQLFMDQVKPDLLSYDNYIFFKGYDGGSYFQNLSVIREFALKAKIPFLNIVQAASWDPIVRVPNANELRWLNYTTLAYGAQGISYYVFYAGGHEGGMVDKDNKSTPLYRAAKNLNREFAMIARELRKLDSIAAYHTGTIPWGAKALPFNNPFHVTPPLFDKPAVDKVPVKGLLIGCFGKDGKQTHALVVNTDYSRPAITTLEGPGKLDTFDAATGVWKPAGAFSIDLRLPPGGGKLIRLSPWRVDIRSGDPRDMRGWGIFGGHR
jgi:hypothetical protein